jgi:predicted O-methyltransferase YrrM
MFFNEKLFNVFLTESRHILQPSVKLRINKRAMNFFQISEFFRFFRTARTKYQLHSPFVFELACAVLEDERWFYAFRDVEGIRAQMLKSDLALNLTCLEHSGLNLLSHSHKRSVRSIARRTGSSARQGQILFRLANHLQPRMILELGTSLGIGTMYLASAVQTTRFLSLEGSPEIAQVARINLNWLGLSKNVEVREGPFDHTLITALKDLNRLDLVFFDGDHHLESPFDYFEECLSFSHEKTVFVFDDMHGSKGMSAAWEQIKCHPRVTLTLDFFELSLAFMDPDFREKQHFNILPARWKPWLFF